MSQKFLNVKRKRVSARTFTSNGQLSLERHHNQEIHNLNTQYIIATSFHNHKRNDSNGNSNRDGNDDKSYLLGKICIIS